MGLESQLARGKPAGYFASMTGIWTLDLLRTIPAGSQDLWITSPVLYLPGNAAPV